MWALAQAKARNAANDMRQSVALSWFRRWSNILACAAQRALALSLLELPAGQGHNLDGITPFLGDVLADDRWGSGPECSRLQ